MDLWLDGKTALVTGASRGIGRAVATVLAREGCDLLLTGRDEALLAAACREIGREHDRSARYLPADLATTAGVTAVAGFAAGLDTGLDILVNNAGAIPPGALDDVDGATWRAAWDLKVFGFIDLTRALYPRLAAAGGAVVNVIGAAGEQFPAGYIAGAAGNAALMAFTRALAKQAAGDGVRVNAINPGPVATGRNEVMLRDRAAETLGDAERWPELTAALPYGRAAAPEEIADAVAFLASTRSAYTNGAILTINGGT